MILQPVRSGNRINPWSYLKAMRAGLKKEWSLHHGAFRRLLEWLDEGADSHGAKYLEMRRRLVAYFVRKNCTSVDDLADETLTRVARRLEEEGSIPDPPAHYCYVVAKFVFLEYQRRGSRDQIGLDDRLACALQTEAHPDREIRQKLLDRLDQCLAKLAADHRTLILEYYCGEAREKIAHRRALANSLGLTMNALSIRASRIRERLEACVKTPVG
jgi:RNA polymerase sigma factor (sigma-70 family)